MRYLLPVKTWGNPAVLGIGLVDLRVGVEQALHGAVAVERSHVEQHLPRVKREEERAAEQEQWENSYSASPFCCVCPSDFSKSLNICH